MQAPPGHPSVVNVLSGGRATCFTTVALRVVFASGSFLVVWRHVYCHPNILDKHKVVIFCSSAAVLNHDDYV